MPTKRRFEPSASDRLEERLVLSHRAHAVSAVVVGLNPGQQVLNARQQPLVAQANWAFDLFESDYGQARATYFASVNNLTPMSPAALDATNAFRQYTTERVSQLSQQLIGSFLQTERAMSRSHGRPDSLSLLISSKIINVSKINTPSDPGKQAAGSLIVSLIGTIPSVGASPSTTALYTLSQESAIATARTAVINGVSIVQNGYYGNQSTKPHSK